MGTKPLKPYPVCKIHIEKSPTALHLENTLGVSWQFSHDNPLDNSFFLRAAISKDIKVAPREIIPIPTGICPQLLTPEFEIEVRTNPDLLFDSGLCLSGGSLYFNFGFRSEIWMLMENKFKQEQIIHPAQKIGIFTVIQRPLTQLKYVGQIDESPWKIRRESFIEKIKSKIRKKPSNKQTEFYSESDIKNYLKDKI